MDILNKAMILTTGLGTQARLLTEVLSKPMIPILGKPVMEHQHFGWHTL
jgi:mannose-1-phosphate guanylyltransferase